MNATPLVAAAFNTRAPEFLAAAIAGQDGHDVHVALTVPYGWGGEHPRQKSRKRFYLSLPVLFESAETHLTGHCRADIAAWAAAWKAEAARHGVAGLGHMASRNITRFIEDLSCDHPINPIPGLVHLLSAAYEVLVPNGNFTVDYLSASNVSSTPSTQASMAHICTALSTTYSYRVCGRGGLSYEADPVATETNPEPIVDGTAVPRLLDGTAAITGMLRMWQASTLGVLLHTPWYVRSYGVSSPTHLNAEAIEIIPTLWPAHHTPIRAVDYPAHIINHSNSSQYLWSYDDDQNIHSYLCHVYGAWHSPDAEMLSLAIALSGGTRTPRPGSLRAFGQRVIHAIHKFTSNQRTAADICLLLRAVTDAYLQVRKSHLHSIGLVRSAETSQPVPQVVISRLQNDVDAFLRQRSGCHSGDLNEIVEKTAHTVEGAALSRRVLLSRIELLAGAIARHAVAEIDRFVQMDLFSLIALDRQPQSSANGGNSRPRPRIQRRYIRLARRIHR